MKSSVYKSYDELPLFLNSDLVAKTLGIAPSSAYELMHEKDFPTLYIGNRMVVPTDKSSGHRVQDVTISYNYIGILPANLLYDVMNGKAA